MKVLVDERVQLFIESLEAPNKARVVRYLELVREYGFALSSQFIKKLSPCIWELRPGNVRLLFGRLDGDLIIVVHGFKKQSQKTPKKELSVVMARMGDYK